MATVKDLAANFQKLDKFEGVEFRRWQRKMHFLLTSLGVAYVLTTTRPMEEDDEPLENTRRRNKWDNDDYICRGHILNGMCDNLFDIYQYAESAKSLWDDLESKYMQEDASSKKFLVSNFNNFRMIDSRGIMDQFHELQRMIENFKQHNINVDDTFIVSSIIDKLPPGWRDVRNQLKHKKDDMNLAQLASHLVIEEGIRRQDGQKEGNPSSTTVNVVEASKPKGGSSSKKRKNNTNNNPKDDKGKKPKIDGDDDEQP